MKYPQPYSPLPAIPPFPLASILINYVDAQDFPREHLHTYLQTIGNVDWEIFVAKVAGIEVKTGTDKEEVLADLEKQHKYNNIFGKMADEMATAIYVALAEEWPVGMHVDYKSNIRKILFELLIEKNSRIVGRIVSSTTQSQYKHQLPYYISPEAIKVITEELVKLTNQRNSCSLKSIDIRDVVSKYIYLPTAKQEEKVDFKEIKTEARTLVTNNADDDGDSVPVSLTTKKRRIDSANDSVNQSNSNQAPPTIESSTATASTPSNKRKAENTQSETGFFALPFSDDEKPFSIKKHKTNTFDKQKRNLHPVESSTETSENNESSWLPMP